MIYSPSKEEQRGKEIVREKLCREWISQASCHASSSTHTLTAHYYGCSIIRKKGVMYITFKWKWQDRIYSSGLYIFNEIFAVFHISISIFTLINFTFFHKHYNVYYIHIQTHTDISKLLCTYKWIHKYTPFYELYPRLYGESKHTQNYEQTY